MTTCGAWAPARQSTTTPRSGPSRCGPRFPAASTCRWTAPGPDPRPGHRRGRQRRPGDLHNPARPARPAGVGHHRRIVRRPRRAGTGWRHSAAWSTPARCVPRSRRCCRWTRPARRWPGWRAGTSAARSCCSPGPSGTAYKPSLRRGTCRPCAQKPNSGALPAASPLTRDNAISADIACRTIAEMSPSATRRPAGPRLRPAALRGRHRQFPGLAGAIMLVCG